MNERLDPKDKRLVSILNRLENRRLPDSQHIKRPIRHPTFPNAPPKNHEIEGLHHKFYQVIKKPVPDKSFPGPKKQETVADISDIRLPPEYVAALNRLIGKKENKKQTHLLFSDESLDILLANRQKENDTTSLGRTLKKLFETYSKLAIWINHKGEIVVDENIFETNMRSVKLGAYDFNVNNRNLSQLESIFRKDRKKFASATIISYLSSDDANLPNDSWLKPDGTKHYYKDTRNLLDAFENTSVNLLDKQHKTLLAKDINATINMKGGLDFKLLNEHICEILFQNYYPQSRKPSEQNLKQFISVPGVAESILALRKIFTASLAKESFGFNKREKFYIYPNRPGETWDLKGIYRASDKEIDSINPVNLIGLSIKQILGQFAFILLEKKIHKKLKVFNHRKAVDDNNKTKLYHLPFLTPAKNNIITDGNGINFPVFVNFEYIDERTGCLRVFFGEEQITNISIPVEKQEN